MKVYVAATLKGFFGRNDEVEVKGNTVKKVLDGLLGEYPDAKKGLYDENGSLRGFINIFVNDENFTDRSKWEKEFDENAEVILIPTIAGGAAKRESIISEERRKEITLDDKEILRRISVLNGEARADVVRRQWDKWRNSGQIERYESDRARFVRRMYDLSEFMKTLKELFTMWYNREYNHVGTMWTGRFKSLLVEKGVYAGWLRAYIEANPVRAGIVSDAADYAWSGRSAALRGDVVAQRGQARLNGEMDGCGFLVWHAVPCARIVAFSNGQVLGSH